jgi:hypothetical protein
MYQISYIVLFYYGGGGGGNHKNNDGKGHEWSRYNYCDDAGCTKVNQCCKFETKEQPQIGIRGGLARGI